ncbi:hypothetical protein [Rosistilla oblonga]|uniref:hypothetical protein n=1 Tax=Rosistilla oblonga TaxID=2527990 RepID=UPI003A96FB80
MKRAIIELKDGTDGLCQMRNGKVIATHNIDEFSVTPEMHGAAQKATLKASEAGEMYEDEPFNIVNAIIKAWGLK